MPINRLRDVRAALEITQEALANALGTSPQQVSRLEKSQRKLAPEWIERLGKFTGLSARYFLEDIPLPPIAVIQGRRQFSEQKEDVELLKIWPRLDYQTKVAVITLARASLGLKRDHTA